MGNLKEKINKAFDGLSKEFGYKNKMQTPRLVKVVVSTGIGSLKDKSKIETIADRLAKITGQKAAVRGAKKSIATFKVRQGDPVGYQVTLRGPRMYDFLTRLFEIAIPRTRDFRGLARTSIDEMGNYTIGIREHVIFPETADEELRDVFGLSVSIVTTAKSKNEALRFLEHIGLPIRKEKAS